MITTAWLHFSNKLLWCWCFPHLFVLLGNTSWHQTSKREPVCSAVGKPRTPNLKRLAAGGQLAQPCPLNTTLTLCWTKTREMYWGKKQITRLKKCQWEDFIAGAFPCELTAASNALIKVKPLVFFLALLAKQVEKQHNGLHAKEKQQHFHR